MSTQYLPILSYGPPDLGSTAADRPAVAVNGKESSSTAPPADATAAAAQDMRPRPDDAHKSARAAQEVPLSLNEERTRAVYTTMERLLEETPETQEALLDAVQHLSGEEYLQVAEERALGGMCGSSACPKPLNASKPKGTFKVDTKRQRVYKDGDLHFCSDACELAAQRLAAKLRSPEAALERFGASQATPSETSQPRIAAAPQQPPPLYAAGSDDTPIMLSQVKERDPATLAAQADRDAELALQTLAALRVGATGSGAVEGYVPRGRGVPSQPAAQSTAAEIADAAPSARQAAAEAVQTASSAAKANASPAVDAASSPAPEVSTATGDVVGRAGMNGHAGTAGKVQSAAKEVSVASHPSAAASEVDTQAAGKASIGSGNNRESAAGSSLERVSADIGDKASDVLAQEQVAQHAAAAQTEPDEQIDPLVEEPPSPSIPQQPVLVFEVEDADGPLEGAAQDSIAARFGRLKVADASSVGLPKGQLGQLARAQQALAAEPTGVEADLALWRQHISITTADGTMAAGSSSPVVPTAPAAARVVAAVELGSEADEDEDLPAEGGDDEEGESYWLADPPVGDFSRQLSQFSRIFATLDGWVTDATLHFVRRPPSSAAGLPEDVPPAEFAQTRAALEGVVARALTAVLGALRCASPRSSVEVALRQLIATFYLRSAVPSLKEREWQLLTLVLLRVLSVDRLPSLQEQFDGRSGVLSLNTLLADSGCSVEEFDALLEVLLPGG